MSTFMPKASEIERKWYIVDAKDQTLGRLASQIAAILRGKHKPTFTPHEDMGDFVIVINAEKIKLTGKKLLQKKYTYHTGYPGGLREIQYKDMLQKKPEEIMMHAVKGMLPKGPLGRRMLKKLRVYKGADHPHAAQAPELIELKNNQIGG